MSIHSNQNQICKMVESWAECIRAGDTEGIIANHADDVPMRDMPKPIQSKGIEAYKRAWEVAFATGLLRIGGSKRPICRLTLGFKKARGKWFFAHEHHSAPHTISGKRKGIAMNAVTLCLGFSVNAETAVNTYVPLFDSVFGNSKPVHITRFSEKELEELRKVPEMAEQIMPGRGVKTIRFTLAGQEILAFNGGGYFGKFHESISLYVSCQTQGQIDKLWNKLAEDCIEQQPCGWIKDKFGVSWQIAPDFAWKVDEGDDRAAADRMNIALFGMKKIDGETLRKACEGK